MFTIVALRTSNVALFYELRRETSNAVACIMCKFKVILNYFLCRNTPTCVLCVRVHSESESSRVLIMSPYPFTRNCQLPLSLNANLAIATAAAAVLNAEVATFLVVFIELLTVT